MLLNIGKVSQPTDIEVFKPIVGSNKKQEKDKSETLNFSTNLSLAVKDDKKPFQENINIQSLYQAEFDKVNFTPRDIEELPDFNVTPLRIGIAPEQKQITLTIPNGNLVVEDSTGKKKDLGSFENATITVKNENNAMVVYDSKAKVLGIFQEGTLKVEGNITPIAINGKKYRGDSQVIINPLKPETLNAINHVMIEDYLKGVVPAESSASWPLESLKAQTIAARTYAVANWKKRDNMGFDLMATTSDQVYKGMEIEQPSTNKAISETTGEVAMYEGKPINALFFSCSGGHTDNALDVWGVDLPYIKGVKDFDEAAPRFSWNQNFTNESVRNAVKKLGSDVGTIKSIKPTEFTEFGRVKKLEVEGTNGTVTLDAAKFRLALGLNSTFWEVKPELTSKTKKAPIPKSFSFEGKGWGHALGMSQWGARQMAEDGKNYQEIIQHYYSGVTLGTLNK